MEASWTGTGSSQLAWFGRDGKLLSVIELAPGTGPDGVQLAADNKRIASGSWTSGEGAIWLTDALRGVPARWTFSGLRDQSPVWSPDGTQIVFSSQHGAAFDLYRISTLRQDPEELFFKSEFFCLCLSI